MSSKQIPKEEAFSGATESTPQGMVVEESWWEKNRNRVAGLLRGVSHSMVVVSGLGYGGAPGSSWRVATGGLGLAGAGFMALFGEKKSDKDKKDETIIDRLRPAHVPRIYYSLLTLSALSLVASGVKVGRVTEIVAGGWTAFWSTIAAFSPEEKKEPEFDNTSTQSQALGLTGKLGKHLDDYKGHPKKLAADMLQVSAGFVLADGVYNKDYARMVSGVCLAASNFAGRTMRDDEAKSVRGPERGPEWGIS